MGNVEHSCGVEVTLTASGSRHRAANWPKCEDGSASLARLGLALSADPEESYELSKAWASVLTGGRGDIPFAAVFGRARVLVSLALHYRDFLPPV